MKTDIQPNWHQLVAEGKLNSGFASAKTYLDSLRPAEIRLSKGKVVALVFLGTLLAGCSIGQAPPAPDTATPTFPPSTPTPDFAPTSTFSSVTPIAAILSITPTVVAAVNLDDLAIGMELSGIVSEFPSSMNVAGDESTGESLITSVLKFDAFFESRAAADQSIRQFDRAFGQLSDPVNPQVFKDRDLGLSWDGFGMGFTTADLPRFDTGSMSFEPGADGHQRAWGLTDARGFNGLVYQGIYNYFIQVKGIDPTIGQIQSLYNQIIFGDWGVKEVPDDADPFTINDHFNACQTYTGDAPIRLAQPESARGVTFDPNAEITGNGREEETVSLHDSDNSVIIAMVTDGQTLWAEFFEAGNDPDPINVGLNNFGEKDGSRVSLKRLVPCGVGAPQQPGQPGQPGQPEATPQMPERPTPMPTNPHIIPTKEPGQDPPVPPQPTEIP